MLYVIGTRIILPNAVAGSITYFKHMAGYAASFLGGIQMLGTALVSYCITLVSYKSLFLLGSVYLILGIISLLIFYVMIVRHKNSGGSS
jgi:hypothetical protein